MGHGRIRERRRGTLTVDGARANTTALYDSGRSLDFSATFTADPFQHVGFGVAFEDAPWAMFSTGGGALAVGLYARTAVPGGPAENTPIAGVDPLVAHDYSIDWTPTEVRYFVDGALVATHTIAITAQLRPVASDFAVGGGSVQVGIPGALLVSEPRHLHVARLRRRRRPRHLADIDGRGHDPGRYRRGVRGPHRKHSDTRCFLDRLAAGRSRGAIPGPVGRRYLQYRATLTTTDSGLTPSVQSVTLGYEVDTSAPAATITDVTVTGTTARVTFSSTATDVARLECSLDNGPFATCTSPRDYTSLSGGSHTIRVRAIDQVGNVGAAAERSFTVDTTAPAVDDRGRDRDRHHRAA